MCRPGLDRAQERSGWPPILPHRLGPVYYDMLSAWLRECDRKHHCPRSRFSINPLLPTRVIDVGTNGKDVLRLVRTRPQQRGQYVALSHRWSPQEDWSERQKKKKEFRAANCTLASNIEGRCKRIDLARLGKTFQDAITITRRLGQRYLWIDSLCILTDG